MLSNWKIASDRQILLSAAVKFLTIPDSDNHSVGDVKVESVYSIADHRQFQDSVPYVIDAL